VGKVGHSKWGITETESQVFRRIMFTRQRLGLPLFHYDRSRRAWFLNLADYRDGRRILEQLAEWEISIEEYRNAI